MARVVVVGSVAVDEVVRLRQPLRSGAHLDGELVERRIGGGAANTGRPLAYAGHDVALVSAVGTDGDGAGILAALEASGVGTASVARVDGPSTRSLVLVDPIGERTVVNLHRCVEPEQPARLLQLPADVLYVRSREASLAPLLASRLGSCVVVAHVPPAEPGSRPAHVLVASASDLPVASGEAPWEMALRVAGPSLRWFVLTRGADGAEAFGREGRLSVAAERVDAIDSTGAGDVFAAGLVHALAGGAAMEEALAAAVRWGTAAVECAGVPAPERIRGLR